MKNIGILLVIMITSAVVLYGQDCKLCGTWIGSYDDKQLNKTTDELEWVRVKKYVRVDKYGEEYKIRVKYENTKENSTFYVEDKCTVLDADETIIRFKFIGELMANFDANHKIVGYDNSERTYELEYRNGYCHLTLQRQQMFEYDRNSRLINQWDATHIVKNSASNDQNLFNENEKW